MLQLGINDLSFNVTVGKTANNITSLFRLKGSHKHNTQLTQ